MKLTFELPEGVCETSFDQCPYIEEGHCWQGRSPGDALLISDDGWYTRLPTCPFHGVVRVTMEDGNP
jgi:hypothetical protein